MPRDRASRDLLRAALFIERHASKDVLDVHLLNAVGLSLPQRISDEDWESRLTECAHRLFSIIGLDLSDFSVEEAIDLLTISSMWEDHHA